MLIGVIWGSALVSMWTVATTATLEFWTAVLEMSVADPWTLVPAPRQQIRPAEDLLAEVFPDGLSS
jgi:hypothetical protein